MQVSVINAHLLMTWLWPLYGGRWRRSAIIHCWYSAPPPPTHTHVHMTQRQDLHQGRKTSCVLKALTHSHRQEMFWLYDWGGPSQPDLRWSMCQHITVWFKWFTASVSTCLFHIQHDIFQADELHLPASECLPLGYTTTLQMGPNAALFKTASQVSWPKRCVIIMLYVILVPFWFVFTQKAKLTN